MRVRADSFPCLLRGKSLDSEIPGFTKDVTRQVVSAFLLNKLTHIATKASLVSFVMIADHRDLKNIPSYD